MTVTHLMCKLDDLVILSRFELNNNIVYACCASWVNHGIKNKKGEEPEGKQNKKIQPDKQHWTTNTQNKANTFNVPGMAQPG